MSKRQLEVQGRTITLSNLDKPLWPKDALTKWDLIEYIAKVGPALVQQLYNRPLTVVRFPDGITGHSFYQKDAPSHTPTWVRTHRVMSSDERTIDYILANDLPTLIWLANQAAIEYHPWMSRIERPDHPDYAVIDLDPAEGAGFEEARQVATVAKEWLDRLGMHAGIKTSGSTGLHIVIPVEPVYPYAFTSRFVGLIGRLLEHSLPGLVTTERTVKSRPRGTVYVDHLQNLPGKTIAAAYSPRPKPGATVSTPFPWTDLASVDPGQFTISRPEAVLRYAKEYQAILGLRQRLEGALELIRSAVVPSL